MDHAAGCALGTLSVAAAATDALLDSEDAVYALTTTLIWGGSATDAAARGGDLAAICYVRMNMCNVIMSTTTAEYRYLPTEGGCVLLA